MRVTMLEDKAVTVDGVRTIDAVAGDTHEMGDGVAQSLIDSGSAKPADDDTAASAKPRSRSRSRRTKADVGADENKDAAGDESRDPNEDPDGDA